MQLCREIMVLIGDLPGYHFVCCGFDSTNRKLLECLCAVIETRMTPFQLGKCLVKTRGVAECFENSLLENSFGVSVL